GWVGTTPGTTPGTTHGTTPGTAGGAAGIADHAAPHGAAPGGQPRERLRGYLEVGLASLANGSIGVMVTYADMPTAMLLCLRMAFAAGALGVVVLISGSWRDLRSPGAPLRLLGISVSLALNLILYFLAIRYTGVAVAIFLSYLAPVYLAFVAPRILHEATDRIVYVALAIGLAGMAVILVPGLLLEGTKLSAAGLFYGWAAGVMYAVYLLFAKSLRGRHVRSTAVVFTQSAFTAAAMLLPGLLALGATHYHFSSRDLFIAALLGLVTTAFSFSIFMDGLRYIRVQHASIIAYIEPVSAPLYALVFLSQIPSGWTIAGGALIVAAGMLVVLYGREQIEPELVG
ncbi:MAG: EamA family transporter, partial [Actinobacteria bacterium]|nr:EamA family transporter [Actinomycetota bacterium]